jgi:hypothetical protein
MNLEPLTKEERDALLARHRAARATYDAAMDAHAEALGWPGELGIDPSSDAFVDTSAYREARAAYAHLVALEDEYFRRLPRVVMAPCPLCGEPLHRAFDPFGLDGLWWRSEARAEEPASCPHFCLLLGAVGAGAVPSGVSPGPRAPYLVPRLLAHSGMVAVVARLEVAGAAAYPIAYFAPRRPPAQTLAAGWGRTQLVYTTQLGEHGWRAAEGDDSRDFELGPYVTRGQLRWCEPGSDRTRLADGRPCPYLTGSG